MLPMTGAALLNNLRIPITAFTWSAGRPTRYRSFTEAERGFYPRCNSSLTMDESVLDHRVQVTQGNLDQGDRVRPDDPVWTESQLSWLGMDDAMPRFHHISSTVPLRTLDE